MIYRIDCCAANLATAKNKTKRSSVPASQGRSHTGTPIKICGGPQIFSTKMKQVLCVSINPFLGIVLYYWKFIYKQHNGIDKLTKEITNKIKFSSIVKQYF